uniref:Uncharacterized protein n=1 Tax=Anguilla anguilla TaxID=7936 RepID=A0A0E9RF80_ANGAN
MIRRIQGVLLLRLYIYIGSGQFTVQHI